MFKLNTDTGDILTDREFEHDTWNTCPLCNKSWKDFDAIAGVIHRTRLCHRCMSLVKNIDKSTQTAV